MIGNERDKEVRSKTERERGGSEGEERKRKKFEHGVNSDAIT